MSMQEQLQADRAHHEGRIAWLTACVPRWACGTPVAKHIASEMLLRSRHALLYLYEHGMSTNSAPTCQRGMVGGQV